MLKRVRKSKVAANASLLALAVLLLAGCGEIMGKAAAGPIRDVDLSGAELTVGSKEYTEQLILGQIAEQAAEAAGASVEDETGFASTHAVRDALENDEIDLYWEYTGTNYVSFLGETDPPSDPRKLFEVVSERELEENDIRLLDPPAPTNTAYSLAVRQEVYNGSSPHYDEDLARVRTLSDMGRLIEQSPEKATLCVTTEFAARDAGLPGLEEAYGYEFPEDNVHRVQESEIFENVDEGEPCNFGEVLASDGRIAALDLRVLEDDRGYFPTYNPTINVREEVYRQNEELSELFAPVSRELTPETMQKLSARVDTKDERPEDVAENWLEEGFIE